MSVGVSVWPFLIKCECNAQCVLVGCPRSHADLESLQKTHVFPWHTRTHTHTLRGLTIHKCSSDRLCSHVCLLHDARRIVIVLYSGFALLLLCGVLLLLLLFLLISVCVRGARMFNRIYCHQNIYFLLLNCEKQFKNLFSQSSMFYDRIYNPFVFLFG